MLRMRIRRAMTLAAAAVLPAFLQGCGAAAIQIPTLMTNGEYQPLDDSAERAVAPLALDHFSLPLPIDLRCSIPTADTTSPRLQRGCAFGHDVIAKGVDAKAARNYVQNELLRRSDQLCSMHISRMLYGRTVGNAGAKVIKSLVSAVNAVTKPAENVVDAMFEDTNLAMGDVEMLKWKAYTDTATRVEKARASMRNSIRLAQKEGYDKYDLSQAVYDAERYHQMCSFANAYSVGEQFETTATSEVIIPGSIPAEKKVQTAATAP